MKINHKRSIKFITLLITSLLIATASAAIYDYMYLNATVGVQGMTLVWVSGADGGLSDAGTQINGVTATLTNLKGPPNGTRIYADPVRLNNTGTQTVTFNLSIANVTGHTDHMDSIVVKLYNKTNDELIDTLTVWSNGAKGSNLNNLQIGAKHEWRFQWEIKWKSTATTDHSVTVKLQIEVPA